MLILDFMEYGTASAYIDFISTLSWFRMYCVGKFGKDESDYLEGFKSLEDNYRDLWWSDEEEKDFPVPNAACITLNKARKILGRKKLEQKQISEISDLILGFLNEDENDFRKQYFDYKIQTTTKYDYPRKLFDVVKSLLDDDHNDETVLASFKYLDNHLQTLLNLSPHEYYGEDLINKAFAPNTGMLQLGTSQSEQAGLRNFFSGANAVFRNPSAHRIMNFSSFEAATAVAMVAVMAKIASHIAEENK